MVIFFWFFFGAMCKFPTCCTNQTLKIHEIGNKGIFLVGIIHVHSQSLKLFTQNCLLASFLILDSIHNVPIFLCLNCLKRCSLYGSRSHHSNLASRPKQSLTILEDTVINADLTDRDLADISPSGPVTKGVCTKRQKTSQINIEWLLILLPCNNLVHIL